MLSKLLKLNEALSYNILETQMELDSMDNIDDDDYDCDFDEEQEYDIEKLIEEDNQLEAETEELRSFLMDKIQVLSIHKETVSRLLDTTNALIKGGLLSNFEQIDRFIEESMDVWPGFGEGE